MIDLFNPIDMDGIPWTGNLSNYIQGISISFVGSGVPNNTELSSGDAVLSKFEITEDGGWFATIKAVHPMRNELFEVDIYGKASSKTHPASFDCYIDAEIVTDTPIKLSEICILPTALCFVDKDVVEDKVIEINTTSPIVSSILDNRLSIEIDTQISKYNYTESSDTGIVSINGIKPMNGNINIKGVGNTVIV